MAERRQLLRLQQGGLVDGGDSIVIISITTAKALGGVLFWFSACGLVGWIGKQTMTCFGSTLFHINLYRYRTQVTFEVIWLAAISSEGRAPLCEVKQIFEYYLRAITGSSGPSRHVDGMDIDVLMGIYCECHK